MTLDAARAVAEAGSFIKNAEEELDRKILREDQLYFVDNQVEALDAFLADTEELVDGSPELADTRKKLRDLKTQLERKGMEFLASQSGDPLPEELPLEDQVEDFLAGGKDLIAFADEALGEKVAKVDGLPQWEEPLRALKSFLADSEPLAEHPKLSKVREEVRGRCRKLQQGISTVVEDWRKSDVAGGDEDDE